MAAAKLQELLPGAPITYKGQNVSNLALLAVMVGWVFFRADTLTGAIAFLEAMAGLSPAAPTPAASVHCMMLNAILTGWLRRSAPLMICEPATIPITVAGG